MNPWATTASYIAVASANTRDPSNLGEAVARALDRAAGRVAEHFAIRSIDNWRVVSCQHTITKSDDFGVFDVTLTLVCEPIH